MSMKIGDLIAYGNIDGETVYGVVSKGPHKHVFQHARGYEDAVKVAWTDDASVTTELLDHLLDPEYKGLTAL